MASGWCPPSLRKMIYTRDGMRCAYCGKKCKPATAAGMTRDEQIAHMRANSSDIATLDHIVPRSVNPSLLTDPYNLITVCNNCNSSKGGMDLRTWCKVKGINYRTVKNRIARAINRTMPLA